MSFPKAAVEHHPKSVVPTPQIVATEVKVILQDGFVLNQPQV